MTRASKHRNDVKEQARPTTTQDEPLDDGIPAFVQQHWDRQGLAERKRLLSVPCSDLLDFSERHLRAGNPRRKATDATTRSALHQKRQLGSFKRWLLPKQSHHTFTRPEPFLQALYDELTPRLRAAFSDNVPYVGMASLVAEGDDTTPYLSPEHESTQKVLQCVTSTLQAAVQILEQSGEVANGGGAGSLLNLRVDDEWGSRGEVFMLVLDVLTALPLSIHTLLTFLGDEDSDVANKAAQKRSRRGSETHHAVSDDPDVPADTAFLVLVRFVRVAAAALPKLSSHSVCDIAAHTSCYPDFTRCTDGGRALAIDPEVLGLPHVWATRLPLDAVGEGQPGGGSENAGADRGDAAYMRPELLLQIFEARGCIEATRMGPDGTRQAHVQHLQTNLLELLRKQKRAWDTFTYLDRLLNVLDGVCSVYEEVDAAMGLDKLLKDASAQQPDGPTVALHTEEQLPTLTMARLLQANAVVRAVHMHQLEMQKLGPISELVLVRNRLMNADAMHTRRQSTMQQASALLKTLEEGLTRQHSSSRQGPPAAQQAAEARKLFAAAHAAAQESKACMQALEQQVTDLEAEQAKREREYKAGTDLWGTILPDTGVFCGLFRAALPSDEAHAAIANFTALTCPSDEYAANLGKLAPLNLSKLHQVPVPVAPNINTRARLAAWYADDTPPIPQDACRRRFYNIHTRSYYAEYRDVKAMAAAAKASAEAAVAEACVAVRLTELLLLHCCCEDQGPGMCELVVKPCVQERLRQAAREHEARAAEAELLQLHEREQQRAQAAREHKQARQKAKAERRAALEAARAEAEAAEAAKAAASTSLGQACAAAIPVEAAAGGGVGEASAGADDVKMPATRGTSVSTAACFASETPVCGGADAVKVAAAQNASVSASAQIASGSPARSARADARAACAASTAASGTDADVAGAIAGPTTGVASMASTSRAHPQRPQARSQRKVISTPSANVCSEKAPSARSRSKTAPAVPPSSTLQHSVAVVASQTDRTSIASPPGGCGAAAQAAARTDSGTRVQAVHGVATGALVEARRRLEAAQAAHARALEAQRQAEESQSALERSAADVAGRLGVAQDELQRAQEAVAALLQEQAWVEQARAEKCRAVVDAVAAVQSTLAEQLAMEAAVQKAAEQEKGSTLGLKSRGTALEAEGQDQANSGGQAGQEAAVHPEVQEDKDDKLCVICLDQPRQVGFRHGRTLHLCACRECAECWFGGKKTCPQCNLPALELIDCFS